jgi:hypothetical protein
MPDKSAPHVSVQVDTIRLDPGQTITVYVMDHHGKREQIEIRCVGRIGANFGYPQIFYDDQDEVQLLSFDDWMPIEDAYKRIARIPVAPQPAKGVKRKEE